MIDQLKIYLTWVRQSQKRASEKLAESYYDKDKDAADLYYCIEV